MWLFDVPDRVLGGAQRGARGRALRVAAVTASDALTGESARLLDASTVEVNHAAGVLHVLCPAGTTFDAAEALRLQLVDRAPSGVTVDVEIAASEPGTLSPEDEAGVALFASERRERMAGRWRGRNVRHRAAWPHNAGRF